FEEAGPGIDPGRRERWLGLALGWLRDVVSAWKTRADREPVRTVDDFRGDLEALLLCDDLRAVRDTEPLARLPEARRVEWAAFWADVSASRDRCERQRRDMPSSSRVSGRTRSNRDGKAHDGGESDVSPRERGDLLEPDPEGVGG